MNKQEAKQYLFNKSYLHIMKQGKPSIDIDGTADGEELPRCMYRSPDGSGCGAVPFIVRYSPAMEDSTWSTLVRDARSGFVPYHLSDLDPVAVENAVFVSELQHAHDICTRQPDNFVANYDLAMRALALRHGLEVPNVE